MNAMKKVMALLLVFALAVSCLPLGAVTAFAAEMEAPQVPMNDVIAPDATEETTEPVTEPPIETEEAQKEETGPTAESTELRALDSGSLMMATSPEIKGGSSGSEVGGGGSSGNAAGDGASNMIAVGVTMQIVYYRYDDCYNRYNSHASVINTVKDGLLRCLLQF